MMRLCTVELTQYLDIHFGSNNYNYCFQCHVFIAFCWVHVPVVPHLHLQASSLCRVQPNNYLQGAWCTASCPDSGMWHDQSDCRF